jgi:hypothetical protein
VNACIILKTTNKDFNTLIPCLWTTLPWEDSTAAIPTLKQHHNHRETHQIFYIKFPIVKDKKQLKKYLLLEYDLSSAIDCRKGNALGSAILKMAHLS